jgi:hypothetical protein
MVKLKKIKMKSEYSICVIDNVGACYLPIARHLTNYFSKVYYYSVNQNPFPRYGVDAVGTGYDGVERVYEFLGRIDEFDIIFFTDLYFSDWGKHLRSMGKMVWGGSPSEEIETNRKLFKQELNNVNLPVAKTDYITGIDNLLTYLAKSKDSWIKISYYRGEMETFHHINMQNTTIFMNDLRHQLGPLSNKMEFIIEPSIKSIAEIGNDTYSVNGMYPNGMMWGLEVKDTGYIGKAINFNEMPQPIQQVSSKFAPVLKKYNHQGFFSTEIRYTDTKLAFFTDPCMRAGSPPSNTMMMMIDNWADIILGLCQGQIVEPKWNAKYGVEIIIKSPYANDNYMPVIFDMKYDNNIKLKGSFRVDGKDYIMPWKYAGFDMVEFGSVVVIGDNIEVIAQQAITICEQIEAYKLTYEANAIQIALEQIKQVENVLNITF